jgi:hypothetical protein
MSQKRQRAVPYNLRGGGTAGREAILSVLLQVLDRSVVCKSYGKRQLYLPSAISHQLPAFRCSV